MAVVSSFNCICDSIRRICNNKEFINSYGSFQDYERDKYAVQAAYELRTLVNKYFGNNVSMLSLKDNFSKLFEESDSEESFSHIWNLLKKSYSYSIRNKFHEIMNSILELIKPFYSDIRMDFLK